MNREAALVVFSGGQDSTTCLFWAKRNFKKVYALSFLYGQKHQKEVEFAREIALSLIHIYRRNGRGGFQLLLCSTG